MPDQCEHGITLPPAPHYAHFCLDCMIAENARLRAEVEQLTARIADLERDNAALRQEASDLRDKLDI